MTPIPSELRAMIAQVRQQHPQLVSQPDEVVAMLIMQALEAQQAVPAGGQDIEAMSAQDLIGYGEQLSDVGRWQEAERYLLHGAERAEKENNLLLQCSACIDLGRLCLQRGNFPQAMTLYQQAFVLAERTGDHRLRSVIYDQMGSTYLMQGACLQATVYYQRSLEIKEQRGDESDIAVGYGNLGNVYRRQGDFAQAIEAYDKANVFDTLKGTHPGRK